MAGWLVLILLFAVSLGGLRLLSVRGPALQIAAAALLLGCAGYALQGSPASGGAPRKARSAEPPVPLTKMRHAFFGQFGRAEVWMRISEALASRGNTEQAAGALQSAVREHPRDAALWVGLGNALTDHARMITPAAEFAYRRAAELAPGHPAPPFFYGLALARSGQPQAALAMWKEVLASAPADASWRPLVENAVATLEGPSRTPAP